MWFRCNVECCSVHHHIFYVQWISFQRICVFLSVCVYAMCTSKQKLKQNKILLKVENLKEWQRWRHKCLASTMQMTKQHECEIWIYRAGWQIKDDTHTLTQILCSKFNNIDDMENAKAIFASNILMMDFSVDFSNDFHVCY